MRFSWEKVQKLTSRSGRLGILRGIRRDWKVHGCRSRSVKRAEERQAGRGRVGGRAGGREGGDSSFELGGGDCILG